VALVQVKVVRKIARNRFTIRSSAPNTEVSWQVSGIRKDAWAEAHRIPVEQDKSEEKKGHVPASRRLRPTERDGPGLQALPAP
jgi:hypothetical protein